MARRFWVIGVVGVGAIALITAPGSRNETAATSATPPVVTTTPPPPPTTTTTAPVTTSTPEPTPTTTSTTTTEPVATTSTTPLSIGVFDGAAFDAVIASATVDVGDISAGAAVMRNGVVLHTAAFGMENPFDPTAATVTTRFRMASVSKLFTSIAIMQLVDEGAVALDRPFVDQLGIPGPFADPRIATITVRQLLSHTSGFDAARPIFFNHGVDNWHQAANNALDQTLQADPGVAFQYSNTNFCVLGLLIEKVTGQPFEAAIRERVLEPLDIHAHLAPTFDTERGDAVHASARGRNYMETLGPAGGWVATPLDLAELATSLRTEAGGPHLLDQATVDAMRVRVPMPVETPPPVDGWSYGLGLMLFGDGSWGHTGTIESTHSIVVNRPDGLTVSVMVSGKRPVNTDDLLPVIDLAVVAAEAP
ncbi:MAG: serine hydrolase domain-containing protein [Ilumatobacteraceae bacterium]